MSRWWSRADVRCRRALAALALLLAAADAAAATAPITGSVRLPDPGGATIGRARIVRSALTPAELAAPLRFSVTLRMRDTAGLRARVAAGEQLSAAEIEARYLPLRRDYERVAAWLAASGFTPTLEDRSHTTVFARGTVAGVSRAFGVAFARAAVADGEYTSAVSEPVMPADLAPVVLSVNALQPQFRLRHFQAAPAGAPRDLVDSDVYVTPDNVRSAYNVPATLTGYGQTIGILAETVPAAADLQPFWSMTDAGQVPGNVSAILVDPGYSGVGSLTLEADCDVEWAGALAPAALLRVYVDTELFEALTRFQNDVGAIPSMRILSVSFGVLEGDSTVAGVEAVSQQMAALAAQGVTVLAASGDSGSNPNGAISPGDYLATAPLDVSYPASDPSVTGVGGTALAYSGAFSYAGETAWDDLGTSTPSASGGGVSVYFARPSWQTGGSLLASEAYRCVPDVAAIAAASLQNVTVGSQYEPVSGPVGLLVYSSGAFSAIEGTSVACPIWAGITALINQGRDAAGLGPAGLLNPQLYALAGTGAFTDVITGTNGAYAAGPGYDLCTGLGSPDAGALFAALGGRAPPSQRLANISARVEVQTGQNILIAGFVVSGPAGTRKDILVRGIGPGLAAFGVAGAIPLPTVEVFDSTNTLVASDTNWSSLPEAGTSAVGATFRQATASDMSLAGAFALGPTSADSALVATLPVGSYTVEVFDSSGQSGVGLAEVYELNALPAQQVVNISSRSFVGTGSQVAIAGFVVSGNQPAQLLVRGVGPGLKAFGVTGTLPAPMIQIYDSSNALIVSNTGWQTAPVAGSSTVAATYRVATSADMASAGAFALTSLSADSALVVTLPPGAYTAEVSDATGSTGIALAEVYELTD